MNYTMYRSIVEEAKTTAQEKNMEPVQVEFDQVCLPNGQLNRFLFRQKVQRKVNRLMKKLKRRLAR